MPKSSRPLTHEQMKITKDRQARRKLIDRIWTAVVIAGVIGVAIYSIVVQISHHP